jgi:hypothetical protein
MGKPRYIALVCLVMICYSCPSSAQTDGKSFPSPPVIQGERILSMVPWTVGANDLLCVITERSIKVNGESGPIRVVTIYRRDSKGLTRIFDSKTLDGFVTAFPLGEVGGRLFVVWTGGSAYHFSAYAMVGGSVRQVLDTGSKGMPEFVIDQNENESILITKKLLVNGEWRRTNDSTTDIYSWDGAKYQLVANVPWSARLAASAPKAH